MVVLECLCPVGGNGNRGVKDARDHVLPAVWSGKTLVFGLPYSDGGGVTGASTLAVGRVRGWGRVPKLLDHQQGPELFAHSPHEGMREPHAKFIHQ